MSLGAQRVGVDGQTWLKAALTNEPFHVALGGAPLELEQAVLDAAQLYRCAFVFAFGLARRSLLLHVSSRRLTTYTLFVVTLPPSPSISLLRSRALVLLELRLCLSSTALRFLVKIKVARRSRKTCAIRSACRAGTFSRSLGYLVFPCLFGSFLWFGLIVIGLLYLCFFMFILID